ncbi:MAG: hypothetical protein JWM56_1087 [Candidatus Peribacteria bacterium]|nr:hypothetical protein [Candidatus Peribacteria bacterium]
MHMILGAFLPGQEFSWEQLDALTGKKPELWTSKMKGILELKAMDFEIVDMDTFDYERYVTIGAPYFMERYGEEAGRDQILHTDVPYDIQSAREYVAAGLHQKKVPVMDDCKKFLDDGYVVICEVNPYAMDGKDGYAGHFILLIGYDDNGFLMHDPGLPPVPNLHVIFDVFHKAWAYPNENMPNLTAVRRNPL